MSSVPPQKPALPRRLSHVSSRRLRDTGVLVDLKTNHIFELNDPAMRVWELLAEASTVQTIAAQLVAEFAVDVATAERETTRIIEQLTSQGVVG
ncbi:MAG: PqqD family protein [Vicinamibacterales bacterium]